MKKLLITTFLISFFCNAQKTSDLRYFKGKKILNESTRTDDSYTDKTYIDDELTYERIVKPSYELDGYLITPVIENGKKLTFKEKDGYEVSVWSEVKKEYGKHFKVHVSILNKTKKTVDFMGDKYGTILSIANTKKLKTNILPLPFAKYTQFVNKAKFTQQLLSGFLVGLYSTAFAYTAVNGLVKYKSSIASSYYSYSSTFYSPALAQLEFNQIMNGLNEYLDYDNSVKLVTDDYIRSHSIEPKSAYEGFFVMDYDKNVENISLRIMVGETPFNFELTF